MNHHKSTYRTEIKNARIQRALQGENLQSCYRLMCPRRHILVAAIRHDELNQAFY